MVRRLKAEEYAAKHRITLEELAGHDDVCSDVLVDNAYYKARIRKNKPKHIPVRGIREDEIPQILLHHVIVGKDVVAAEKAIMKLSGLQRYHKSLRNKQKQDNFMHHLRKYIYMYQTDCPWEVSTTNRYTIITYEAAVTARKRVRQGETIKYLTGTLVPLTTEESLNLDLTNRNFSIVVTGRKKSDQMFLGPARFANHDCDSNARLIMKGPEAMEVIAVKSIDVGDEITVSYGDNYFGPDNVECLCHTCEMLERNGWTSKAAVTAPQAESSTPIPDIRASVSLGSKRERTSSITSESTPRGLKRLKALPSPSKLINSWTPTSTPGPDSEVAHGQEEKTRGSIYDLPQDPPQVERNSTTPQRNDRGRFIPSGSQTTSPKPEPVALPPSHTKSFPPTPSATSSSSQDSEIVVTASDHAPLTQVPVTVKMEVVEKTAYETNLINLPLPLLAEESVAADETPQHSSPYECSDDIRDLIKPPPAFVKLSMSKITTYVDQPPHDITQPNSGSISVMPEAAIMPSIESTPKKLKTRISASLSIAPVVDTIRVPGDYVLTRKLLAQPHDRWVRCHNEKCLSFFLQPNGYQTRRECPRCERHSMLYGFPWPKTDPDARKLLAREKEKKAAPGQLPPQSKYSAYKRQGKSGKGSWVEGGGDEEERVMDHRTIHRFVLPDEERELTRKGLLVEAEEARKLGDGWQALAKLDGRAERFRNEERADSRSRESSEPTWWANSPEGEDAEGRRRSNRIVDSRVYVKVDMKR